VNVIGCIRWRSFLHILQDTSNSLADGQGLFPEHNACVGLSLQHPLMVNAQKIRIVGQHEPLLFGRCLQKEFVVGVPQLLFLGRDNIHASSAQPFYDLLLDMLICEAG
jgi:hypothetical protein